RGVDPCRSTCHPASTASKLRTHHEIGSITVHRFRYRSKVGRDSEGHGHPGEEHDAVQSLLKITTDDFLSLTLPRDAATRRNGRNVFGRGPSGHYFGEISDVMVRGGVGDVGGITPLMKIAHLAEAFGMHGEVLRLRIVARLTIGLQPLRRDNAI